MRIEVKYFQEKENCTVLRNEAYEIKKKIIANWFAWKLMWKTNWSPDNILSKFPAEILYGSYWDCQYICHILQTMSMVKKICVLSGEHGVYKYYI